MMPVLSTCTGIQAKDLPRTSEPLSRADLECSRAERGSRWRRLMDG